MSENAETGSARLILARGLALFLDCLGLLVLMSQLGGVGFLVLPLLLGLVAKWGTSPGKFLLGIKLDVPPAPFSERFEKLIFRGLIKYGLLALSATLLFGLINLMNRLLFETWTMLFVTAGTWPLLVLLPHLQLKGFSQRLIQLRHEQISAVAVIPAKEGQPSELRQALFSLVFILCNGILLLVSLPNSNSRKDRAKVSSVKANMHTFQTMVETYAVDHQSYPKNVQGLRQEASGPYAYWKEFDNPFTAEWGQGKAYLDDGTGAVPGAVSYRPLGLKKGKYLSYVIYGFDQQGQYILNNQKAFTLEPDLEPIQK